MNIALWVLQVLLAIHTAIGAFWKFSNPSQSMAPLESIPQGVWIGMAVVELVAAVFLIAPLG